MAGTPRAPPTHVVPAPFQPPLRPSYARSWSKIRRPDLLPSGFARKGRAEALAVWAESARFPSRGVCGVRRRDALSINDPLCHSLRKSAAEGAETPPSSSALLRHRLRARLELEVGGERCREASVQQRAPPPPSQGQTRSWWRKAQRSSAPLRHRGQPEGERRRNTLSSNPGGTVGPRRPQARRACAGPAAGCCG